MQDRFRFRLFDTRMKRMVYNIEQSQFNYFQNGYDLPLLECAILDEQNIIKLMQCVGLKDKNGKLIYEGDIIRVQYIGAQIPLFSRQFSNLPKDEIFAIIYDHDWHKFRCENLNYKKTCEIHSLDLDAIQINTENKQYEIIGNIYENPELIEGSCL